MKSNQISHIILHHIISDSHVLSILYDAFQRQSDMLLSYLFSDKKIRQNLKKKMREVKKRMKRCKKFSFINWEKKILKVGR